MKKSAKKMTDSLIDVGQSSKKFATKVEAARKPKKKLSKVINEKMKALQLKEKVEEARDITEFTSQSGKKASSYPERFRAEIRGLDTGAHPKEVHMALTEHFKGCGKIQGTYVCGGYAHIDFASLGSLYKALELNDTSVGGHVVTVKKAFSNPIRVEICGFGTRAGAEEVHKALREHFEGCGRIEEISVNDKYAYIDFASIDSLYKALELDNTRVDDCPVRVQPIVNYHTATFKAVMCWFDDIDLKALMPHFDKWGGIATIHYRPGLRRALIEFTNLDSLNKALKLNNTDVGHHRITMEKCIPLQWQGHKRARNEV